MKQLFPFFLFLYTAIFSAEHQEKKESTPLPAKKIKPHFAGVRRGSSTKLKYIVQLPKIKKSTDNEKIIPASSETR